MSIIHYIRTIRVSVNMFKHNNTEHCTCLSKFPRKLNTRKVVNHSVPSSSLTADMLLLSKYKSTSFLYCGLFMIFCIITAIDFICKKVKRWYFIAFLVADLGGKVGYEHIQGCSVRIILYLIAILTTKDIICTHTMWI